MLTISMYQLTLKYTKSKKIKISSSNSAAAAVVIVAEIVAVVVQQ